MSDKLQLSGAPGQILAFARALTLKQKFLIGGGAVLVAGLLAAFVTFMNRPDFKPLASGLSTSDAQSMNNKLLAKGIHSQVTQDGTGVEVVAEQLDKARLEVAGDGMPSGGRLGYEIFDKPNWMGSDFAEKVNYQRALEGELERTIGSIQEVDTARVHLVLEKESLFTDREREAKASVVLKLKRQLTPENAAAIKQLVANAVDGLNPDNVSLVSADGRVPLLPKPKSPFGLDNDLEETLGQQLLATLEPVLGAGHVKANVRVEYDTSTSDETKEVYDPNSAIAITKQTSREKSPAAAGTGIPGTASNVPSTTTAVAKPTPPATATDSGPSSESESATYAVNRTVRHMNQPAGAIKRITAAIMLDAGPKPRTPEEIKQIESIAGAAVGIDTKRGDSLVVESLPFQPPVPETVVKVTPVEKATRIVHEWSGAFRVAGILLLFLFAYMLVLRPVKTQMLDTMRQLTEKKKVVVKEEEPKPLPEEEAAQDTAMIRRELAERVKTEPELSTRLLQTWMHKPEGSS